MANPSQTKTLLEYLRTDLGLTGTKFSCGESSCGSCTVTCTSLNFMYDITEPNDSVDDLNKQLLHNEISHRAINACTTKLVSLHGMSITTIEYLGSVSKVIYANKDVPYCLNENIRI